jgi:hypothetical protein
MPLEKKGLVIFLTTYRAGYILKVLLLFLHEGRFMLGIYGTYILLISSVSRPSREATQLLYTFK